MASPVDPRLARRIRFGPYELDTRSGELLKHGVRLLLREQPLRILILLLDHPGELVTREEIRGRLWPSETIVEFDRGINTATLRLRQALGETAKNPNYIETVGRRGYRFVGEIDTITNLPPSSPVPVEQIEPAEIPHARMPQAGLSRKKAAGVVVGLVLVALIGWKAMHGMLSTSATGAGSRRVRSEGLSGRPRELHPYPKSITVGNNPQSVVFDGANVWVSNTGDNTVSKISAGDGTVRATFTVGRDPDGLVFDGSNIWVANTGSNSVTELRASDGIALGTFSVGPHPEGIAFDGSAIWTANTFDASVTKLAVKDGTSLGTFKIGPPGINPQWVLFDGRDLWVSNLYGGDVVRVHVSDGKVLNSIPIGSGPAQMAFDGENLWVADNIGNTVTKLRVADGFILGTFAVGAYPVGVAFDGRDIWVSNAGGNSVTRLLASDGSVVETLAAGAKPQVLCFDGAHVWVPNFGGTTLLRF